MKAKSNTGDGYHKVTNFREKVVIGSGDKYQAGAMSPSLPMIVGHSPSPKIVYIEGGEVDPDGIRSRPQRQRVAGGLE